MDPRLIGIAAFWMVLVPGVAGAQAAEPGSGQPHPSKATQSAGQMDDMPGMDMTAAPARASTLLMEESSGTSMQPCGWTMPMVMTQSGGWQLAWMAQAFVADVQQSRVNTPPGILQRGGDKLYSTNWGMLSAQHALGGGTAMLRTMVSLEPATITGRRYPELFQTGETAFGQAIVDGQHPHNLVMELGAQYAHPLGAAVLNLYYAPVGDPALGPTAYPHRASAAELPQAALGHHYEDSTHIATNVATAELAWRRVHVEAGGFHGREPGENRWTLGFGPMDSWTARLTWLPAHNWQAQVSTGRLHHPEAMSGDELRTTASVEYAAGERAVSVIWGRDYKTAGHLAVNALTTEAVLPFARRNYVTGRFEWSQRDELFADDPSLETPSLEATLPRWFDITAYTAGYTRDVGRWHDADFGVGANATAYGMPSATALTNVYGAHPWGVTMYVRVRLKAAGGGMK